VSKQRNVPFVVSAPTADDLLLDRPLTARSIILSLLLGRHSASAPVADLVRWCGLFGITEGAARVALSRAVAAGELRGDQGEYAIVGRLRERREEQEAALAVPSRSTDDWDGAWRLALVDPARRDARERGAFRVAASRLHLVELREGVWGRPDNLAGWSPSPAGERIVAAQVTWWTGARPPGDQRRLVARAYDTAGQRDRGVRLLRRLDVVTSDLRAERLADAFVVGAAVAQFLRRDPLLPAELLPARWPGNELRQGYGRYRRRFGAAVAAWLSA
jgi:phenylacetic acid degradation operon negative regulatory protein